MRSTTQTEEKRTFILIRVCIIRLYDMKDHIDVLTSEKRSPSSKK